MEYKMPLFENAIDVLESAIMELEAYVDWTSDDIELRLLNGTMKRSIQHISNCAELFIKYRLCMKDWKYVFDKIKDASEEKKMSGEFNSVRFDEGIRRLKKHCTVKTSFEELKKLHYIRNGLEHFGITKDFNIVVSTLIEAIKELIIFCENEIVIAINDEDNKEMLKNRIKHLERVQKSFEQLSY